MSTPPNVESLPGDTIEFANRMFDAARNGDEALLIAAIERGLPVNLTNAKGNTLLMLAAYAGHLPLSIALLDRGADPNATNDMGQTIVAGAVFKGHVDIAKALLAKGADPNVGVPSAIQAAQMFKVTSLYETLGITES